ncbi:hypothetical protein [Staphylococcus sp. LCT-H4]|uniref:hypothetical protein n=1 Tax=Staphylococcus sp. LCT-H4 TaxID=1914308 RepID=UPI0008F53248|nr:hypothetical protein [Staphylococcus sp. LCT-H4]OIJ29027.1 hypothetical protein BK821_12295 [Staphylococcus sp. LCT-H4]
MRNIKKFAKDFNMEYTEDNGYVYVKFNNVKFSIRRKGSTSGTSWSGQRFGSPKGYSVSNSEQRYSEETTTQKDVIAEIVQVLRVTNNATDVEMKELNEYLYNLQYK